MQEQNIKRSVNETNQCCLNSVSKESFAPVLFCRLKQEQEKWQHKAHEYQTIMDSLNKISPVDIQTVVDAMSKVGLL